MGEQHSSDLRNVREGDTVEITTTGGETFEADCTGRQTNMADPQSGHIRETRIWQFTAPGLTTMAATIVDGLKSSPNDPDFPQHSELWDMENESGMGYIEDLRIYGEMEQ